VYIAGKVVVVTGGADGIGRALCERFAKDGAKTVIVVDRNGAGAAEVAQRIGGRSARCDVGHEDDIVELVRSTENEVGPIELFCSNAGIGDFGGNPNDVTSSPNEAWARGWAVNVMAHVYAARALLPRMTARGGGYFLNTVSAAGLLNQIGSAVYGVTKHAAVGFAESLAITHADRGIRVSILCPQAVDTAMLRAGGPGAQHVDGVLTPKEVADTVVRGLADERFLILPHPQVAEYVRRKGSDYDRWIKGMIRFRSRLSLGASVAAAPTRSVADGLAARVL
jgi:NAD(P)-dependent dehydrogenase (short-subunit alcohol dehydrogenase family)